MSINFAEEAGYKSDDAIISASNLSDKILDVINLQRDFKEILDYSAEERVSIFEECVRLIKYMLNESHLIEEGIMDVLFEAIHIREEEAE